MENETENTEGAAYNEFGYYNVYSDRTRRFFCIKIIDIEHLFTTNSSFWTLLLVVSGTQYTISQKRCDSKAQLGFDVCSFFMFMNNVHVLESCKIVT